MSKIRRLYFFDKRKSEEMISFLNNSVHDSYINNIMFNPLLIFHHFLPLKFKFLPESYVLTEDNKLKGLITVAPITKNKFEIQKLFFEENSLSQATELIQYVVSKYKALGVTTILVKVDDYLTNLLSVFVTKCGFSQISYEKLWRINKFIEEPFDKKDFRSFKNSDTKSVANLYNDSLLPHFRPLLGCEVKEFKENLFQGLTYFNEYKYVIEDHKTETILGYLTIQTSDNENYVVDIVQSAWVNLNINSIINYATYQIKKRKKRFGLFVRTKRYINIGEKYEEQFMQNGFECVQNQVVLTNSSAKVLKEEMTKPSYITLSNFLPTTPATSQCNKM